MSDMERLRAEQIQTMYALTEMTRKATELRREIERLELAVKSEQDGAKHLRAALRSIQDAYWPVMDDVKYQSRDLCVAIEKSREALDES